MSAMEVRMETRIAGVITLIEAEISEKKDVERANNNGEKGVESATNQHRHRSGISEQRGE